MLHALRGITVFCALLLLAATGARAQQLPNPFCNIATIAYPNHPMGGQATFAPGSGQPVILIDPYVEPRVENVLGRGGGSAFMRFLLAHECAHHVNDHLRRLSMMQQLGPYALLQINPRIELDADCWAARQLKRRRDIGAIRAAADFFARTQGPFSGSVGYPTGNQRARRIARCGGL